jgi:hypothetical protein
MTDRRELVDHRAALRINPQQQEYLFLFISLSLYLQFFSRL